MSRRLYFSGPLAVYAIATEVFEFALPASIVRALQLLRSNCSRNRPKLVVDVHPSSGINIRNRTEGHILLHKSTMRNSLLRMSDDTTATADLKAELANLGMEAVTNPDEARAQLQGLIYTVIADDNEQATKLGIDAGKLRELLGDANHNLVLTGDSGTVIKNLLAALAPVPETATDAASDEK